MIPFTKKSYLPITILLLLLCAALVAPAMATTQTNVVEDGVHLLTFDDAPTKLDSMFYHLDPVADVVVDGDQFYWVRIGNVKASMVSKNEFARLACKGALMVGAGSATGLVVYVAGAGEVATAGTASPAILPTVFGAISGVCAFYGDTLSNWCPEFEKWFVNNKYRLVASDGTILLSVKKTNTPLIAELKRDGLDIAHLRHLTK
jgi:hypothetical protein